MNFSVFLGNPSDIHFKSTSRQWKPSPKEKKQRKKSPKQIQRDNERAAKFQEKKRQEEAAAKAASGVPTPATSSPAASTVSEASVNFSFASPAPEDVTNGTMEGVSDPQPSPENLRQHLEDQSSLNISHNEDVSRDITEPSLVLLEDKDTAYEETESPGLDFEFIQDVEAVRKKFRDIPVSFGNGVSQYDWVQESKWFQMNKAIARNARFEHNAQKVFSRRILRCKKPKLFVGLTNEEPCNSPAYECCACSPRTPISPKKPWARRLGS